MTSSTFFFFLFCGGNSTSPCFYVPSCFVFFSVYIASWLLLQFFPFFWLELDVHDSVFVTASFFHNFFYPAGPFFFQCHTAMRPFLLSVFFVHVICSHIRWKITTLFLNFSPFFIFAIVCVQFFQSPDYDHHNPVYEIRIQ